jgi:small subunit ribosomal protein S17
VGEEPVAEPVAEQPAAAGEADETAEEPAEAPAAAKPTRTRKERKAATESRATARSTRAAARPRTRKPIVRLPKPEHERGRTRERVGVVVSAAGDKTIVVTVETSAPHPRYKKVVRRSRKFHAHDAENAAKVGDVVRIAATRPLSRLKHWRLVEVVQVAQ